METIEIRIEDVKGLAGYLADLDDSGEASAYHEAEGAWTVLARLGLADVIDAR